MSVRTWILGAGVSAAVLAGWAGRSQAQAVAVGTATATQKPAAVVNGEPITLQELDAIIKRAGPSAVAMPESKQREIRLATLATLIDDVLLQQHLRQNGPRVDPAEVAKRIAEVEEGLKKQGKSLQDYFKETGQNTEQLRQDVVTLLQWRDYIRARVSDVDVKRYYDENKDFFDGVGVRASHIVLRVPQNAAPQERQTAREKLLAIRQEIMAGKLDFVEAAKKHSQCPSAPQGGDIGMFPRKTMVDENFAKAAFALQVGQLSDVVPTEYGLHLIKVTERKPGQGSEFDKVKEEVREFCVMEMRQYLLQELRKTAKVEVNVP